MYSPSEYEMKMFREMEGKYVSENEKVFFETMRLCVLDEGSGIEIMNE